MAYIEEGKGVSRRGVPTSVRGEAAGETGTATRLRPRLEARSPHTPSLCSRGTSCRVLLCFEITQIFLLFRVPPRFPLLPKCGCFVGLQPVWPQVSPYPAIKC